MENKTAPKKKAGEESTRDSFRPDFLKRGNGGETAEAEKKKTTDSGAAASEKNADAKKNDAADQLRGAEESATGGFYRGGADGGDAEAETGYYNPGETDEVQNTGRENKGRATLLMRKFGPLTLVLGLFALVGFMLVGAQGFMPVAISEMIIQKFNTIGVSTTKASDNWLDLQLSKGLREEDLSEIEDLDKNPEQKYALSKYQAECFERLGLKVVSSGGQAGIAYPVHGTNTWMLVVSESGGGGGLQSLAQERVAEVGGTIAGTQTVEEAMVIDDFKMPYIAASKTWRGGNSGWYDEMMNDVTETKMGINRNRWSSYDEVVYGEPTEAFLETAKSEIREKTSDMLLELEKEMNVLEYNLKLADKIEKVPCYSATECGKGGKEQTMVACNNQATCSEWNASLSAAGKEVTIVRVVDMYNIIKPFVGVVAEAETKVTADRVAAELGGYAVLRGYKVKLSNESAVVKNDMDESELEEHFSDKATKAGTVSKYLQGLSNNQTCATVDGMVSMYTVTSTYQTIQSLNMATGYLEAVDKMKAGSGDKSPINEYALMLVQPGTVAGGDGGATKKTAMESQGMRWLFSDLAIDPDDASIKNVNFESYMANTESSSGGVTVDKETYEKCGYSKISEAGSNKSNLTQTGTGFVPVIGKAVEFAQVTMDVAKGYTVNATIQGFYGGFMPSAAKKVYGSVVEDSATEWVGEDLGNLLFFGAKKYISGNAASGGQGPASKDVVVAYLDKQQEVIAEEARYQRAVRSPFDISSQYTFLGSLAYSMVPMAYSAGGIMSVLSNFSSMVSSAVVGLTPAANAVEVEEELTSLGECPFVQGIGGIGDGLCNSYVVTDTGTIEESPIDVYNEVKNKTDKVGNSNFDNDGKINKKSDLAKYITYCGQRVSSYGIRDATITTNLYEEAEERTHRGFFGWLIRKIISLIPAIKDTQDALEMIDEAELLQWVTGEACVAADDNPYWNDTESWNQYYQRYAENERLVENMNPGYESSVTAYVKNYYKENPVDNSLAGQIARFSGMSVEKVNDTIALMEYYDFLNNYDASTRFAFGVPEEKEETMIMLEPVSEFASVEVILPREIAFYDVRNRNFVV